MEDATLQSKQMKELSRETSLSLMSSSSFDLYKRVLVEAGVLNPDVSIIAVELKRFLKGVLDENGLLAQVVLEYSLEPDVAKTVLVTVVKELMVSFDDSLKSELNSSIELWGGEVVPDKNSSLSVQERYVDEYITRLPSITDERVQHRLKGILLQYLLEAQDHEQTKVHLMDPFKLGGLGLDETVVETVLTQFDLDVDKKGVRPVKEVEVVMPVESEKKEAVVAVLAPEVVLAKPLKVIEEAVAPPVPTTSFDADFSKEENELTQITKEKSAILTTKGPLDVVQIVNEICKNPTFQFKEKVLQDRCQKLIESRVRDVRDAVAVREKLERSVDKGGLGVRGRRLADVLQAIEEHVHVYQDQLAKTQLEERAKKDDSTLSAEQKKEAFAKKEEQIMSKRYAALTGKMPGERISPVSPSVTRTSAALSAHHEQQERDGKIDPEKVRSVVQSAKTAGFIKPLVRASSPSMQEVTFAKRLSGPIDELRMLSLTDFRRLSADPQQAATKVKDKVDLMEDQGYDKKVEAIQAWRSSPVNQQYVELTREAVLSGVSVSELLLKRRGGDGEVLSDQELKVIMKLNAELRF